VAEAAAGPVEVVVAGASSLWAARGETDLAERTAGDLSRIRYRVAAVIVVLAEPAAWPTEAVVAEASPHWAVRGKTDLAERTVAGDTFANAATCRMST